jgi:lysyl endopeptidase
MRAILYVLVLCIYTSSIAQVNIGGYPNSKDAQLKVNDSNSKGTKTITLSLTNLDKINHEDKQNDTIGKPFRYGISFPVEYNLNNSGEWTELENGDRIWQLYINCPNAKTINLLYDKFWLPEKSSFYIYNLSNTDLIGGFTDKNNKGSKAKPGKFATGLVYDDQIVLEYYEPFEVKGQGIISVAQVIYGYRHIGKSKKEETEALGGSGSCQVNVNCSPEGDNWKAEKTSVAKILFNGYTCSGCLINNTQGQGTPYFLTANHCIAAVSLDAITNPDASDWIFYWNYESSDCGGGNDFIAPSTTGATVVANNSNSDFALMKLQENPYDLQLKLFFSGWERNNPGQGGVGIHHPQADIKKISTHTMIPSSSGNYWNLYWSQTANGFSVTEGGSSGSPLYNNNHRIVGQLYGGSSINCSNPAQDLGRYGKFSISWDNSTDYRRRLKDWLDPINSDVMFLNGTYCTSTTNIINQTVATNIIVNDCNVNIQNVNVQNNSKLTIDAVNETTINGLFEVKLGSELEIK